MGNLELRKLLLYIGITSNLRGYHYIIKAVEIIKKQKIHTNMYTVYEMISKGTDVTPGAVERAIRQAIKKSFNCNERLNKLYSNKPNNAEFIYDLVYNFDVLKRCIKE